MRQYLSLRNVDSKELAFWDYIPIPLWLKLDLILAGIIQEGE